MKEINKKLIVNISNVEARSQVVEYILRVAIKRKLYKEFKDKERNNKYEGR